MLAVILIATLTLGYNPYVTNMADHGSPFYPTAGRNSVDVLTVGAPPSFLARPTLEKLLISLFSRSSQSSVVDPILKIPGVVQKDEVRAFTIDSYDVGYGGFGPLFSAVLVVVALMTLGLAYLAAVSRRRSAAALATWFGLLLVVSILINAGAWWARLAPQIWPLAMAPLAFGWVLLADAPKAQARVVTALAAFGLALAVVNVGIVSVSSIGGNLALSRQLSAELVAMSKVPPQDIAIDTMGLDSSARRMREAGVGYTAVTLDDTFTKVPGTFARVGLRAQE